MEKFNLIYLPVIMAMLIVHVCSQSTLAKEGKFPFHPGERMVFEVKWAFIPAGEGVLEVKPIEDLGGVPSYHFVFTAKTNEVVDLIYKVRNKVESYVDTAMTHSILYKQRERGKSRKDVTVHFDLAKLQAQYSLFGEKKEPVPITPGTFDPLSVFFALRLYDPNILKEISIPVSDGKKCVMGRARIIKRERIRVAGVAYDTFLAEPELEHIGGVFRKSPHAKIQIWVTADQRRIPVRIKSRVIVGSFTADLVSYEEGIGGEASAENAGNEIRAIR